MDQQEVQLFVRYFDMIAQYFPGVIESDHVGLLPGLVFKRIVNVDVEPEHFAPSRESRVFALSLAKPRI